MRSNTRRSLAVHPAQKPHRIRCPVLTGTDADFMLDGLLLNGKAIIAPARLGRDEISQLAASLGWKSHYSFGRPK